MPLNTLRHAAALLSAANAVVCLTGAGVSAESGIPTFREAQTGLWSRYDPEELASPAGFARDPSLVWRWYMWRLSLLDDAAPNSGHLALADLARQVPHFTLVTQNVDALHEAAGNRDVIHLHGSLVHFHCSHCGQPHALSTAERDSEAPPRCVACGGAVRPGVVWFGETLPTDALIMAIQAAERCDVMLVVGTSGLVNPAAQLPYMAKRAGARVIDVNPQPGPISQLADVYLQGTSGKMLPSLLSEMEKE